MIFKSCFEEFKNQDGVDVSESGFMHLKVHFYPHQMPYHIWKKFKEYDRSVDH